MRKEFQSACKEQTIAIIGAAAFVIAAGTVASASTVLSDGDFTSGISTATYVSDSTNNSVSGGTCATCGNPSGAGLQANWVWKAAGTSSIDFVDSALSYDPHTQGAIASLGVSVDKQLSISYSGNSQLWPNDSFGAVIYQDGKYYVAHVTSGSYEFTVPGTSDYVTLSGSGLTAADFSAFDFTTGTINTSDNPNFAGDTIEFGIGLRGVTPGCNPCDATAQVNLDNVSFTVSPTPLPAALPLFATGLGVLGLFGWRRKRKNAVAA
jgi:hypothetical protein